MVKVDRNTGERKINTMLFVKKTRRFEKFLVDSLQQDKHKNIDNLLYIELNEDDAGRHVLTTAKCCLADFLDEFTEDNIKKEIDEYFNVENTYKKALKDLRSEHDTESMMYQ